MIDLNMVTSAKPNGLEPLKRWNRTDDKKLFHVIRKISKFENITLDDLVNDLLTDESSPYWK